MTTQPTHIVDTVAKDTLLTFGVTTAITSAAFICLALQHNTLLKQQNNMAAQNATLINSLATMVAVLVDLLFLPLIITVLLNFKIHSDTPARLTQALGIILILTLTEISRMGQILMGHLLLFPLALSVISTEAYYVGLVGVCGWEMWREPSRFKQLLLATCLTLHLLLLTVIVTHQQIPSFHQAVIHVCVAAAFLIYSP